MDSGRLVPDELVINLVKETLNDPKIQDEGWMLDGFPRTLTQARAMHEAGIIPDKLVILDVEDNVLIQRITGRRMDPVDNKIYNIYFNPPPHDIEHRLIQRADDNEDTLRTRLSQYHANIDLIRDFYGENLRVESILADRPIEEVYVHVAHSLLHK